MWLLRLSPGWTLLDYTHCTKPTSKLSRSFQAFADEMGQARSDLAFFQKGKLVDGEQTCAESTIDFSIPIDVADRKRTSSGNALRRSTTATSSQSQARNPAAGGATAAEKKHIPPAARPPRPSAPTDDPKAGQRPIPASSARQHPPAATSATPAAQGANVGQGGRAQSSTAAAPDKPSSTRTHVASKKRGSGDFNASDGNAEESLPGSGEPPTKKKAKDAQGKWDLSCSL